MTDDKQPIKGDLLGRGAPGRPAAGRGPNNGGEFSQEDYHHPSAGWGAARSVAKVLAQSRELVAGTRANAPEVRLLTGRDPKDPKWIDSHAGGLVAILLPGLRR